MVTVYMTYIFVFKERSHTNLESWRNIGLYNSPSVIHAGYCVNESQNIIRNMKNILHTIFSNHIVCNLRNHQNVLVTMG